MCFYCYEQEGNQPKNAPPITCVHLVDFVHTFLQDYLQHNIKVIIIMTKLWRWFEGWVALLYPQPSTTLTNWRHPTPYLAVLQQEDCPCTKSRPSPGSRPRRASALGGLEPGCHGKWLHNRTSHSRATVNQTIPRFAWLPIFIYTNSCCI